MRYLQILCIVSTFHALSTKCKKKIVIVFAGFTTSPGHVRPAAGMQPRRGLSFGLGDRPLLHRQSRRRRRLLPRTGSDFQRKVSLTLIMVVSALLFFCFRQLQFVRYSAPTERIYVL
jgi:hypothetical protein